MNRDTCERLIDALLDGAIDESDFVRLEAELLVNPAARQLYYDRTGLDTLLSVEVGPASETGTDTTKETSKVVNFPRGRGSRSILGWAAAASVALFALVAAGWVGRSTVDLVSAGENVSKREPVATGFGVVASSENVEWKGGEILRQGDLVAGRHYEMASGALTLELFSGVTVRVEGESHFEMVSPMEMAVTTGRVQARVPEVAEGFRVTTPKGEVIDLGTEFSLNVTEEKADLHVIDGSIEWYPEARSGDKLFLGDGEALRWTDAGGSELDASEIRDRSLAEFEAQASEMREERLQVWKEHRDELSRDPRLIAYFTMDRE
ncbi:MAG: FecR domain-containing protein, partial [Verrucomicrobiota bacterium]